MRAAYVLLVIYAFLLGSVHPLGKIVMLEITPLQLAFVRSGLTFISLAVIFSIRRDFKRIDLSRKELMIAVMLGVLGFFFSQILLFNALQLNPASINALLVNTNPIFLGIFASLLLGERFTRRRVLGVVLSFMGVYFVISRDLVSFTSISALGTLFALLSAVVGAAYVLGGRVLRDKSSITITLIASLVGASLLATTLALTDGFGGLILATNETKMILLYIGVLATGLPYTLRYHLMRKLEAIRVGIFSYLIPVFAAVLSFFWIGEELYILFVVGMGLIFVGIRLVQE